MALGLVAVLLGCPGCGRESEHAAARIPSVVVAPVVERDVSLYGSWVGTMAGYIDAQIRPQVKGYLIQQDYQEGSVVEKDALLFQIDPRQFQADLAIAQATLAEARATLGKSTLDVDRYAPLAKVGAVSQEELDNAVQAKLRAEASVAKARAEVQQAQLNLSWTRVTSPIEGIAGIATAQIGDLVDPATVLTTVSQLDPIKVAFPISEQEYLAFTREGPVGSSPGRYRDALELTLANGDQYPHRGSPSVVGREVDARTGTILIEGLFPNPESILRPGQYAAIRAPVKVVTGALLVPQVAVQEVQGSYQVAVVGSDEKVKIQRVEVGERSGEMWIVRKGVTAGGRVVVEGLQKVKDGMQVKVASAQDASASSK